MTIDYTLVFDDLENYLDVLKYYVSDKRANELVDELEDTILDLGNNYMDGTQVCPYESLGQKKTKNGYASIDSLRMKRFKKWTIVFLVDEEASKIRVTKLVHDGYPFGEPLNLQPNQCYGFHFGNKQAKDPLKECLQLMVKLGCFKQYQIESLRERGLL